VASSVRELGFCIPEWTLCATGQSIDAGAWVCSCQVSLLTVESLFRNVAGMATAKTHPIDALRGPPPTAIMAHGAEIDGGDTAALSLSCFVPRDYGTKL